MSELLTALRAFEGQTLTPTTWGPDEVNTPMKPGTGHSINDGTGGTGTGGKPATGGKP